ncbi:Uncharacterised protein [Mycoplasmopsis maculosa]|uniref:Uncharacterized protein n=1 Tax=Mycoplasmopsis maculosa TaxID=114885 RepID=A0A449B3V0_9BACT|nr:hypothetical protein [Mycoplasmopsis maculosa]VEU75245.1 Uncharacterised protein [Mycoplasmopsis maculosa]
MRKNKLILRSIVGSSFLSILAPIMISSTTTENTNSEKQNVVQILNRPRTAIELWKQEYVNSQKEEFKNLINAKAWNDFEGGLTQSQIDFLNKKVETMTFDNYNSVRQEILKLGHESKEAFSRLITFTFGGTYFNDLMSKTENASINETIKNGFDSLRVFSRTDLLEDQEYKLAFEEYKTTSNSLFQEIKTGDNLDNAKLVNILTRANAAYEKFSAVIKSRTDAKFNKLKEFDYYHNYLVKYFYAEDKIKVNGNPNEWNDRNYYVGLAGNWTILIGNLANDDEISNLLYKWNISGTNDQYNHFLQKIGDGADDNNFSKIQGSPWFTLGNYGTPLYHAKWTKDLLSYFYNYNDLNFVEADKSKKEVHFNFINKVQNRYYENTNGHRYFIEKFNFKAEDLPITIYLWRNGNSFGRNKPYNGKFYEKDYNNVSAWKSKELEDANGFFNTNSNLIFARDNYAVLYDRNGWEFSKPRNINGNDKLAALATKIEEKKRELE